MTTRYDAWSELPAPLAEALRASLYSGDWSAWEPDVVEAFRQALNDGDWSSFDPQTAATIRAAIGQEQIAFEARTEQERTAAEVKADRELAAEENRMRATYGEQYDRNRKAILDWALKGNLADIEIAFKAWSHKNGLTPTPVGQSSEPPSQIAQMEGRVNEIRAQLADLGHGALGKRSQLKFEMEDLQDKIALALVRDNPDGRRDATDAYNSARSTRIAGPDRSRVSTAEKRAHMDLEALDLISGRTQPPTPKRKSSAERAADNAGLDDLDRTALALMHGESIGEPEISTPNAEAVLQESTEQ